MDNNFAGGGNIYQTNWNTIPDIQSQFATTNYAYHPLFAVGRNQPQPNVNTYDANNKLIDPWANVTNPKYLKQGASGLDNNFVDGWGTQSLVTCTDCHDNDSGTGARGPHGSAQPWILKGIDQTVTVTTAGAGTIQPNADADTTKSYIAANFCVNCHRADVYGWGANLVPTINGGTQINNEDFSRLKHLGGAMRRQCASTDVETGKGGYRNIGCLNCHGGGEVGGIHGSNLGVGNAGQAGKDEMGKRFMNGNSWSGHILADQTGQIGCYTGDPPAIGVNMSGCSGQHSGGKNVNPTYYYQWQ
jgi:cytochrome c551/c552